MVAKNSGISAAMRESTSPTTPAEISIAELRSTEAAQREQRGGHPMHKHRRNPTACLHPYLVWGCGLGAGEHLSRKSITVMRVRLALTAIMIQQSQKSITELRPALQTGALPLRGCCSKAHGGLCSSSAGRKLWGSNRQSPSGQRAWNLECSNSSSRVEIVGLL